MKKKLSYIILAVVLIAFAGVYAIVDKNNSVYDRTVDTSAYVALGLEDGEAVSQTFTSKEEKLDALSIKMSYSGDQAGKLVSYALKDEKGQEVQAGEFTLDKLKAGKFFRIEFDKMTGCKGKTYTLDLTVEQCEKNAQVTVYAVPGASEDAPLTVKEEAGEGVMVLRTVTHRFDVETFVVTLVFMLYVIVFLRWLAKVFK